MSHPYASEPVGATRRRDGNPPRLDRQAQPMAGVLGQVVGKLRPAAARDEGPAAEASPSAGLQPRRYRLSDLDGKGAYPRLAAALRERLGGLAPPARRVGRAVLDLIMNGDAAEPELDLDYLAEASGVRRDRVRAQVKQAAAGLGWTIVAAAGERRVRWPDAQRARFFLRNRAERCRRTALLAGLTSKRQSLVRRFVDVDPGRAETEPLLDGLCRDWMAVHGAIHTERQRLQLAGVNVGDDPLDPDGSEAEKRSGRLGRTMGCARKRLKQTGHYLKQPPERARVLWADRRVQREMTLQQVWGWVSFRSMRALLLGFRLPEAVPELLLDAAAVRRRSARAEVARQDWVARRLAAEAEGEAADAALLPVEVERAIEAAVERRVAAPALPAMPYPGRREKRAAAPVPEEEHQLPAEKAAQLAEIEAAFAERQQVLRQEELVQRELARRPGVDPPDG